ncbi:MAG: DNA polymerase III subunit alpha, partial [Candidatus Parcubacteria bacterium]|nr:DNA polymerase III subunit alpha [Candidatus Parcubacteria bacterium]
NLYGAIEFYTKALSAGIKPIIGCEFYVAARTLDDKNTKQDADYSHLLLLAKNEKGYRNLLKLVTISNLRGFYYKPRIDHTVLKEHSEGLICATACLRGEVPRAILNNDFEKVNLLIDEYKNMFTEGDFYLELQHHPELEEQKIVNEALIKLGKEKNIKTIVTCDSHYLNKEDLETHEILLAVQTGSVMEDEKRFSMRQIDASFKTAEEIAKDFPNHLELFDNIQEIVDKCNLHLEMGKVIFPSFDVPDGLSAFDYLRELANQRYERFYKLDDQKAQERLSYELGVIKQTGFSDYFLIVQDFVNYCRNNGILTNTRGSAAGCMVSYILGITDVDPLKYDLYFERFLNPDRIAPPDIDVDVADNKRNDLIQYITDKYGEDHVSQIVTFGVMKARLASRDVTRALGLPYSLGDQISKFIPFNADIETALEEVQELRQLYDTNPEAATIIDNARKLEGVVRHASPHAAGIIISKQPLTDYVPLQHSSRNEKDIISQYSMYDIEKIGLLKIDILGLANLTVIKNALRIIKKLKNEDQEMNLDSLGFEDKKVFQLLSKGETVGVFQLESSGMRRYLQELKPTCFEDIVAMVALYRPGPMDLLPSYIDRKNGREKISYLHPLLEPILSSTYGVMIYQEQLMKVARDLAGFTLAEADILRKAVGKKNKELLNTQKEKMLQGMVKNNINKNIAEKIWNWFEPFAQYGFNKSHAVSYARIAYQTAWLKSYYPAAFMAALLTSDFGNLDRIAIEVAECEKIGAKVKPPSVNYSFVEFGVEKEKSGILFGLSAIKNVGVGGGGIIIEKRQTNGVYLNISDFVKRSPRNVLNKKALESLIKAGALDCFGDRQKMLDKLPDILNLADRLNNNKNNSQQGLFGEEYHNSGGSDFDDLSGDTPRSMKLAWEKEYLGLHISEHPLDDFRGFIAKKSLAIANLLPQMAGRKVKACGLMCRVKKITTKTGRSMVIACLSDTAQSVELVFFPTIFDRYSSVIVNDQVVIAEGKLEQRNGEMQIVCDKLEALENI